MMGAVTSALSKLAAPVGQVFTPLDAARAIVREHGVVEAWLRGARVLDPTAGEGAFLEALVCEGLAAGRGVRQLPLDGLLAIERDRAAVTVLVRRLRERYGVALPSENIRTADLFDVQQSADADVLVGNPPWINFADLPSDEKQRLRPLFVEAGLVGNARKLLLGSSRIDLAALVVAWSIERHLVKGGRAVMIVPLSLYLNDGAHDGYRRHSLKSGTYALRGVWDYRGRSLFDGVSTRYGVVEFERDAPQRWPVPWFERSAGEREGWIAREAAPVGSADGPLAVGVVAARGEQTLLRAGDAARWRPRQGVNPCGATELFFFDACEFDGARAVLANKRVTGVEVERTAVFPLLTPSCWGEEQPVPRRWVVLPHDRVTGRPLSVEQLASLPLLRAYLERHSERLRARKGTMLGSLMRRGVYWALLGVGPYSFATRKVVWEAFGRSTFRPRIVGAFDGQPWQCNQALHASIATASDEEAQAVLDALSPARVEPWLEAFRMGGTCNWAQPGRVARFLSGEAGVRA
jgi:hypothetical protein